MKFRLLRNGTWAGKFCDVVRMSRVFPIRVRLLRMAGRKLKPVGLVSNLTLAANDYTRYLPPILIADLTDTIPRFIDALSPNPRFAKEARRLWEQAGIRR